VCLLLGMCDELEALLFVLEFCLCDLCECKQVRRDLGQTLLMVLQHKAGQLQTCLVECVVPTVQVFWCELNRGV